jgi:hypothetical protein
VLAALAGALLAVSCAADAAGDRKTAGGKGSHVVVDQFGYLPDMAKIAVIRSPVNGFDHRRAYVPSPQFELVDADRGEVVFSAPVVAWGGGKVDAGSGDRAWRFDFSTVTAPGRYYARAATRNARSHVFEIGPDVYREVLRQAFRTFYYQRAGFAKAEPYAEAPWTDAASHLGPLQDGEARRFDAAGDPSTARDLSGGWYDAGDYNKYTNWSANYVVGLLHAFTEHPAAWGDDFGIPESGNGVPDILDEARWGVEWLARMQEADGGCLSIVGLDHGSPPSAADGPSRYGPASTSATLSCAAAFAFAANLFAAHGGAGFANLAADLGERAERAWQWAAAHPDVVFRNNDPAFGSQGLGAGQQEVDDAGRRRLEVRAAIYLLGLTGAAAYDAVVRAGYREFELMRSGWLSPWRARDIRALLYYAALPAGDAAARQAIVDRFRAAMQAEHMIGAFETDRDPYLAHLDTYTWGSSATKTNLGGYYFELLRLGVDAAEAPRLRDSAAHYLHYMHGVNPLAKVYLSNMRRFGAENPVASFYHSWFTDGSALWDDVRTSRHGPAPGFVVGGPNPSYSWDGCCPSSCGSAANNARCGRAPPAPPAAQPPQKSYVDFNTSWPLNSWSVTENSNGYQVSYLRLLAQFVAAGEGAAGR